MQLRTIKTPGKSISRPIIGLLIIPVLFLSVTLYGATRSAHYDSLLHHHNMFSGKVNLNQAYAMLQHEKNLNIQHTNLNEICPTVKE